MLWTQRWRHRNICLFHSVAKLCTPVFISSFGWIVFHFKMQNFKCRTSPLYVVIILFDRKCTILLLLAQSGYEILVIQPCHLLNPLALILKAQSLLNIQHLPTVKQTQTPPAWTAAGDASPCSFGATLTRTCSRWRSAPCAATPSSPTEAAQQNEH